MTGTSEQPAPGGFGFALPEDEASRDRLAELGQLAGGLVHELKNPLGAVELNAQLLLSQAKSGPIEGEKGIRRLERIVAGCGHLTDIIQAFLAFARPGKPDRDRVDVNRLIGDLVDEQAELLAQVDVQVVLRREDGLFAVAADATHLRSAFLNIILNARDALAQHADGDRRIVIATRNRKQAISVVIANNGPPLSERAAAHLFDPFFSDKEGGTGLGLAIVRRLLELHHASVSAHSDPSQGVSFTIDIPTTLGPAQARDELPLPEVEARVVDAAADDDEEA